MVRRSRFLQGVHRVVALLVFLMSLPLTLAPLQAQTPKLMQIFGRRSVEADPSKAYELTELEGPWMILASTFAGPTGEQQARALVLELRRDYNLPAYIHREKFDFTSPIAARDPSAKPMRYANAQAYEAYAVLVGEFDSANHPELDEALETIKSATPQACKQAGDETDTSPMAAIRKLRRKWIGAKDEGPRGPMAYAFATKNPLLPDEFFSAPEVDSFVFGLNKDVQHSLLNNPAKYTVVVRTFEGLSTLVDGKHDKKFVPSGERLDQCAELAHKMTMTLRARGVEAYEFHDRSRSLVTIGSFESLGQQTANGGFAYDPAIRNVMQTYCAGNHSHPTADGKPGIAANHVDFIPYDVRPAPIAVPKKSKRSIYASALGLVR